MGDALSTLADTFRDIIEQQFKKHPKLYGVKTEAAEDFARDAADWAISHCRWHLALGECISLDELACRMGETPNDLEDKITRGELVGLQGQFDTFVPEWQLERLDDKPFVRENAAAVIETFRRILGRFYRPEHVISWAATRQPEIENRKPRDVMGDEGMRGDLIRAAKLAARSLE